MAKATVEVTQVFQQVASGAAIITIATKGSGSLLFNEVASDDDAYRFSAAKEEQFDQSSSVPTFVRATGDGWVVIVDGVL